MENRRLLIYQITAGICGLLPLILIPYLTSRISPGDYGRMNIATTLIALLSPVAAWGIGAYSRMLFALETSEEKKVLLLNSFLCAIISALFTAITVFLLSPHISQYFNIPIWVVFATAISAGLSITPQLYVSYLIIKNKVWKFSAFEIGNTVFALFITIGVMSIQDNTWTARVLAILFTNCLFTLLAFWSLRRLGFLAISGVKEIRSSVDLKPPMTFGASVVIVELSSFTMRLADRLLIMLLAGPDAAGFYAVAAQICSIAPLLTAGFQRYWSPIVLNSLTHPKQKITNSLGYQATKAIMSMLVITIFLALTLPYMLNYILPDNYGNSNGYIKWILLGYLFNAIYILFIDYAYFFRKTKIINFISLVSILLYAATVGVLWKSWGAYSVVIAFCLTGLFSATAMIVLAIRSKRLFDQSVQQE
jgi:O-antigen/teichoic acid export membrane protein